MTRSEASFIVQPERELIRVSFFSSFFYQRAFDYFFFSARNSAASSVSGIRSADVLHVHRSTFTRLLRRMLTH